MACWSMRKLPKLSWHIPAVREQWGQLDNGLWRNESNTACFADVGSVNKYNYFLGSQVRVVTLEMVIILLKELIMYTENDTRCSYLNDSHLALIEVWNTDGMIQKNNNHTFTRLYNAARTLSSFVAKWTLSLLIVTLNWNAYGTVFCDCSLLVSSVCGSKSSCKVLQPIRANMLCLAQIVCFPALSTSCMFPALSTSYIFSALSTGCSDVSRATLQLHVSRAKHQLHVTAKHCCMFPALTSGCTDVSRAKH